MLITLSGMYTFVRTFSLNAFVPMLMTGRPLVMSGITTGSLVPVYAVIVSVPLLVIKVNWPRTAIGMTKIRLGMSNKSIFMTDPTALTCSGGVKPCLQRLFCIQRQSRATNLGSICVSAWRAVLCGMSRFSVSVLCQTQDR